MALAWAVYYSQNFSVNLWMQLGSAFMIGLGTALGDWRVIRTLGMRVTRLEPASGFAANICAAGVIEMGSKIGLPVSTSHTATTAIMGVGATKRLSAVRWGVTQSIMSAWLITYPFCAILGWALARILGAAL